MNILILGSGGREHALAYSINKSTHCKNLYTMPGNPGMASISTCIDADPLDNDIVKHYVKKYQINLIIPGSEVYLENGISDIFTKTDTFVFGPSKKAAQIESSKEFAKDLMEKYNIPTARYSVFDNYNDAEQYIKQEGTPIVIKYDGLAGGKGVVVAMTNEEALEALDLMLIKKKYGDSNVIIEEYLEGPEFSLMCFVHNDKIIPMPIAQDHKRLLDNDKGPNTGGMGIYSGVPIISDAVVQESMDKVMIPTIDALAKEGASFTGFLYGGLMLTKDGPKVIEFNARFGDPETEVILPKLETDIVEIIMNLFDGNIIDITWNNDFYVGVVLASKGYPNTYKKGYEILGIETCNNLVFHMGTKMTNGILTTNGGRVLLVTGSGKTLENAIEQAYNNVQKVKCPNLTYRSDIGKKSLMR